MKIPKILSLAKKCQVITLVQPENQEQYISFRNNAYCISSLPHVTEDQILTMMDVPAEKRPSYEIYIHGTDRILDYFDTKIWSISSATVHETTIIYKGKALKPIEVNGSIVYIPEDSLKPFEDESYEIYPRKDGDSSLLAVKAGMIVLGVIIPVDICDPEFCSQLQKMAITAKMKTVEDKVSDN